MSYPPSTSFFVKGTILTTHSPTEEVREIAAKGGHASHGGGIEAENQSFGTQSSGTENTNPGNFANRLAFPVIYHLEARLADGVQPYRRSP